VAHPYNPSYKGGRDRTVLSSRPDWAEKHETLFEKYLKQKGLGTWLRQPCIQTSGPPKRKKKERKQQRKTLIFSPKIQATHTNSKYKANYKSDYPPNTIFCHSSYFCVHLNRKMHRHMVLQNTAKLILKQNDTLRNKAKLKSYKFFIQVIQTFFQERCQSLKELAKENDCATRLESLHREQVPTLNWVFLLPGKKGKKLEPFHVFLRLLLIHEYYGFHCRFPGQAL
jgi:hypothetical protein